MSDLSPAALAVLKAANGASSYGPEDILNDAPFIAAATLRAAADHMHRGKARLCAIAAELESQPQEASDDD